MSTNRVPASSRRIATRTRRLRVESLEPRLVLSAAGAATATVHPFGHPNSAAKAEVSTRIRLATTMNVIAYAQMSDGSVWSDRAEAKVTIGGCGG